MQLEFYEKKVLSDRELPIQMFYNEATTPKRHCNLHWHEHLEMHYVYSGSGLMVVNQKEYLVEPGDLAVFNSNELHMCSSISVPHKSFVLIFDPADLSRELAEKHMLFQPLIRRDRQIMQLMDAIAEEEKARNTGYKQMVRALVLQLLVYISRNYVNQMLPEKDSIRRDRDLERLNAVLVYMEQHYAEPISVHQLAELVHLSEDRFGHLFREGVGMAPLQYIHDTRLKKAMSLLQTSKFSVTEVAEAVGFTDYNHFGRLFRRKYGCTPNSVRTGKQSNSGIV